MCMGDTYCHRCPAHRHLAGNFRLRPDNPKAPKSEADWRSRNYLSQSLQAEEFELGLRVIKAQVRDKQRAAKALRLFKTAKTTEAGEHYFWLYYRYLGGTPLY